MQRREEDLSLGGTRAPLFSSARFDEDSIFIYPLLAVFTIALYLIGFPYLAIIPSFVILAIFVVEAYESVYVESRSRSKRHIVGEKCVVVKSVSRGKRGVVKIVDRSGSAQWELWSAESSNPIEEGDEALVKERDGLFLQIEPLHLRS